MELAQDRTDPCSLTGPRPSPGCPESFSLLRAGECARLVSRSAKHRHHHTARLGLLTDTCPPPTHHVFLLTWSPSLRSKSLTLFLAACNLLSWYFLPMSPPNQLSFISSVETSLPALPGRHLR